MQTKGLLFVTFILNLILLAFAYKILGVFFGIALSIGAYSILVSKDMTRKWATKVMLYIPHILGIFAVQSLFKQPFLTLLAGIGEVVVMLIFGNL